MKHILTVLLLFTALFTVAQDTTRLDMIKDIKSIGRKITTQELQGRAVDNVRFGKITGKTDTLEVVVDRWKAINGGIFGNGSDMTSRINTMLGLSYVPNMVYGYDTIKQITVSGTVTHSKPAVIERGTSFTGTGTLNFGGQIVEADPDQVIFGSSLTVTGIRTKDGRVPAKWFGTVSDNSTDNKPIFDKVQAALFSKEEEVYVSGGKYKINSVFSQTRSFVGEKETEIIYNSASTATGINMWTINDDSIKLRRITIDGNNKTRRAITISSGMTDIEIAYCTIKNFTQVGADASTVEGIFFSTGMDRLNINHNYIINGDAPNTGAVNGIRGASTSPSPKDVRIMYNYFDNIISTSGTDDADQIKIQDYTDTTNMVIAYNIHKNIWKRAAKLQANGIDYHHNEIWSTRYITSNQRSYSAWSIYASYCRTNYNTVWQGVFGNIIDVGSANTSGWDYNQISFNKLYANVTALGINDGIRFFGTNIKGSVIEGNWIQNVRKGIWLDCSSYFTTIINNTVWKTTQTAVSTIVSSQSFPNNWQYGLVMNGNRIIASTSSSVAFEVTKVNGFTFMNNTCDSTVILLNNSQANVDSIVGNVMIANNNNHTTGGRGPQRSTYANRLLLTNANACTYHEFFATDSQKTYMWIGGNWVSQTGGSTASLITKPDSTLLIGTGFPGYDSTRAKWSKINQWIETPGLYITNEKGIRLGRSTNNVLQGIDFWNSTNTTIQATVRANLGAGYMEIGGVSGGVVTRIISSGTAGILINGSGNVRLPVIAAGNPGVDSIMVRNNGELRSIPGNYYSTGGGGSGTVTSVSSGNGMNFTTITGSGAVTMGTPSNITSSTTNSVSGTTHTHALDNTGVSAGSYTNSNITVDAKGRITAASNGSSGSSGSAPGSVQTISDADYTFTSTDYSVVMTNTTATRNVNIPDASTNINRVIFIRNAGSHSLFFNYAVTYSSTYSDAELRPGNWVALQAKMGGWYVIGTGNNAGEGKYNFTLSNNVNCIPLSIGTDSLYYTYSNNSITVSGTLDIGTITSTTTETSFDLSLPISSTFPSLRGYNIGGSGTINDNSDFYPVLIKTNSGNAKFVFKSHSTGVASRPLSFSFTYKLF